MELFQNIDQQLTDHEKQIKIPELIEVFKQTDQNRKITGKRICNLFVSQGYPLTQQRLCLWISFIRQMNMIRPYAVIGAHRGYFISKDPEIIRDQIISLQGRINSMKMVIDSLESQRQNLIRKPGENLVFAYSE